MNTTLKQSIPIPVSDAVPTAIRDVGVTDVAKHFRLSVAAVHSWIANRHVPGKYASYFLRNPKVTVSEQEFMDANDNPPTQVNLAVQRDLGMLRDLAAAESAGTLDAEIPRIADTYDIPVRLVRGLATKNHRRLNLLLTTLMSLDRAFANSGERVAALDAAAKTLSISRHELNRQMRKYGVTPPKLESVAYREDVGNRKKRNKRRLATAMDLYVSGRYTAHEAAELGETSYHYLMRLVRHALDGIGETPTSVRGLPEFLRAALGHDLAEAMVTPNYPMHTVTMLRLWRSGKCKAKRVRSVAQDPKAAPYAALLVPVIGDFITFEEVKAAKGVTADFLRERFTSHLAPYGLTWVAVEQMDAEIRAALYETLSRIEENDG